MLADEGLRSAQPNEIGFSAERFEVLEGLTENHFWFAGRIRLVLKLLRTHLPKKLNYAIDLGCGPGHWLAYWTEFAETVYGIDPFYDPATAREPVNNVEMIKGTVQAVPADDNDADLVLMLDVLEHVDDNCAMDEVVRVLKPGGYFLATVPAMPWLWSFRDESAGHLRRYTLPALRGLIEGRGLEIDAIQYYQSLLMPVVAFSRFVGRSGTAARDAEDNPPKWLNALFRGINLFEVNCGLRLPFGSSLIVIARLPE
jgi:SAM-dependent methyltransferase